MSSLTAFKYTESADFSNNWLAHSTLLSDSTIFTVPVR
jgi:hypothetical protein